MLGLFSCSTKAKLKTGFAHKKSVLGSNLREQREKLANMKHWNEKTLNFELSSWSHSEHLDLVPLGASVECVSHPEEATITPLTLCSH